MIILKQKDTRNALRAILKDCKNEPILIANCKEIKFCMSPAPNFKPLIYKNVYVPQTNAEPGEVWVLWEEKEVSFCGSYLGEFRVVWDDDTIEHFPNTGYFNIKILPSLEGGNQNVL